MKLPFLQGLGKIMAGSLIPNLLEKLIPRLKKQLYKQ